MTISLDDYFMHRDIEYSSEFTPEIQHNAIVLLDKVNGLIEELKIIGVSVSSGWRPPFINAKAGGAKGSHHLTGHAIDLSDPHGVLASILLRNIETVEEYDLYMEDPKDAPTHVHLQDIAPKSGKRVFKA